MAEYPSGFLLKVERAIEVTKTLLETTRDPSFPHNVSHSYEDKFLLVEFVSNTALAATLTTLEVLGLKADQVKQIKEWSKTRSVTLRFKAEHKCIFNREVKRDVEPTSRTETDYRGHYYGTEKVTHKVITTVTEFFWDFSFQYELFAFVGNEPDTKVTLLQKAGGTELMTSTKISPVPASQVFDSIDLSIGILFQNLTDELMLGFKIDRSKKGCYTPVRNMDTASLRGFYETFSLWARDIDNYFRSNLFLREKQYSSLDLPKITGEGLFVPVVPLMEAIKEQAAAVPLIEGAGAPVIKDVISQPVQTSPILPISDLNKFLGEQKRQLEVKREDLAKMFPVSDKKGAVITVTEAFACTALGYCRRLTTYYESGVMYVEQMLRVQLVQALGKVLTSDDFGQYMDFHNRNLFKEEYAPQPFAYAVRRPNQSPEGVITIEQSWSGGLPVPIKTNMRRIGNRAAMKFALGASTAVSFVPSYHLHAWTSHQFHGSPPTTLCLNARTRQFSSMLLVIGGLSAETVFEPKAAIILQNKDDLKIPLTLEMIPPPSVFKKAIESMSPEMQRFSSAYRSMQEANTIFGVCIIQIKPQIEKLLELPEHSLTKKIKLTRDLMELLMVYQIPGDLLSFRGDTTASEDEKVKYVEAQVTAMNELIQEEKNRVLRAKEEERRLKEEEEAMRRYAEEERRAADEMERIAESIQRRKRELAEKKAREEEEAMSRYAQEETSYELARTQMAERIARQKREIAEKKAAQEAAEMERYTCEESSGERQAAEMRARIEARKRELAEKKAAKEAEEMAAYAAEEATSEAAARAMKERIEIRKAELAAQKAKKEAEDMAAYAAQEKGASDIADAIAKRKAELAAKKAEKEAAKAAKEAERQKAEEKQIIIPEDLQDVEVTKLPQILGKQFELYDEDNCLRPTIIKHTEVWTKKEEKTLLSPPTTCTIQGDSLVTEKNRAFDLLDAITRSGALSLHSVDLHIVIGATHCFDQTLLDTVIEKNVNPIEKVERSVMIQAQTLMGVRAKDLLHDDHRQRFSTYSPKLLQ